MAKGKPRTPKKASQSSKGAKKEPEKKAKSKKRRKAKDRCFVISPFGGWHDDYYAEIFCPSIKAAGLEPTRADDLFRSSNIVHDIWHSVSTCRVLLADLTGKNPNVFYELGLAHAARKPVLLVTQTLEDVPFDLQSLRVITYDVEHPSWGRVLTENIKQGLKEMLESPERSVLPTFLLETPDEKPRVSPEEARIIRLQQQVDSMQSELRETRMRQKRAYRLNADEARALLMHFVEEGMPYSMIMSRLIEQGAPVQWIEEELHRIESKDRPQKRRSAKTGVNLLK